MAKKKPQDDANPGVLKKSLGGLWQLIDDISSGLKSLTMGPLREFKALGRRATTSDGQRKTSLLRRITGLPVAVALSIFSVIVRVLFSPVELLAGLSRGQFKKAIWILPWIVVLGSIVGGGLYFSWLTSDARIDTARSKARRSFEAKNFADAAKEYQAVIDIMPTPQAEDQFFLAVSFAQDGKIDKAKKLLDQLAPAPAKEGEVRRKGYPPAHRLMAIRFAEELRNTGDKRLLAGLKHHLDQGGDDKSPKYQLALAEYYLAVGAKFDALNHMKAAAELRPQFLMIVAEVEGQINNEPGRLDALRKAGDFFQKHLENKPSDEPIRLLLAKSLFQRKLYVRGERALTNGLRLASTPSLKSALANYYIQWLNETPDRSFTEKFGLIQSSLRSDINCVSAYQAILIEFQAVKADQRKGESIKQYLLDKQRGSSNESSADNALVDFTLSNISWIEAKDAEKSGNEKTAATLFDQSQDYMETAFKKNDKFTVVANNLAWLLAHAKQPDLDRAEDLAKVVIAKEPQNIRFRDTLATIYKKQAKLDLALAEFQKVLKTIPDPARVHREIADILRQQGKSDRANDHINRANQATTRPPK